MGFLVAVFLLLGVIVLVSSSQSKNAEKRQATASLDARQLEVERQLSARQRELDGRQKELDTKQAEASKWEQAAQRHKQETSQWQQISDAEREKFYKIQRQVQDAQNDLELLENDSRFELSEMGFYAPMYDFDGSKDYELRLVDIRSRQKFMLSNKEACTCDAKWTIDGSRAKGKQVSTKIMQLMLRAFNGESDAIIAKVKFSNVAAYEKQLYKSFEAINKLGSGFLCRLSADYLALKVQELHLVYEYNEKLYEEKEEQRSIKEQMRDEKKAQEELERAEQSAKAEEERYQLALDRAKAALNSAHDSQKNQLLANIAELERKLKEAEEKSQRAISMAQQTKRGHVYIISNIGSFGENIFKIGMTRRLDPQERVDELGGPSVPFRFDVHAMIKTEDAPALEHALHREFHQRRVNKENKHKEFFSITLSDIEEAVKKYHGDFTMTKLAEAREYRKGLMTKAVSIPLPPLKPSKEVSLS